MSLQRTPVSLTEVKFFAAVAQACPLLARMLVAQHWVDLLHPYWLPGEQRWARRSCADFAIPQLKIAIEIDSAYQSSTPENVQYTYDKRMAWQELGWQRVDLTWTQVENDPVFCVTKILRALAGVTPEPYAGVFAQLNAWTSVAVPAGRGLLVVKAFDGTPLPGIQGAWVSARQWAEYNGRAPDLGYDQRLGQQAGKIGLAAGLETLKTAAPPGAPWGYKGENTWPENIWAQAEQALSAKDAEREAVRARRARRVQRSAYPGGPALIPAVSAYPDGQVIIPAHAFVPQAGHRWRCALCGDDRVNPAHGNWGAASAH